MIVRELNKRVGDKGGKKERRKMVNEQCWCGHRKLDHTDLGKRFGSCKYYKKCKCLEFGEVPRKIYASDLREKETNWGYLHCITCASTLWNIRKTKSGDIIYGCFECGNDA